ncbi:unnamed protein product [Clonostachys rosea f. rosea IK726]|uniref:Uncharacterized protein n=2 Tax=Bionectria ochroleuca TaxID=29856 RepID=A0A0B7KIY0_BIOOC|nr:unnamed protein product [Clonostachys rosea f. rosea IK726]
MGNTKTTGKGKSTQAGATKAGKNTAASQQPVQEPEQDAAQEVADNEAGDNKGGKTINEYLPSQHPWHQYLRDSLQKPATADPKMLYYLGAVKIYKGEANLPTQIKELLKK